MNQLNIKLVPDSGGGDPIGHDLFAQIVSLSNLFLAWQEFKRGKTKKADVQYFAFHLENNLFRLHHQLIDRTYRSDPYQQFYITDPKLRSIHKASVRDRVLHQAVFRVLNRTLDPCFIHDSYSCRNKKGTHRAVKRLDRLIRKASDNYHRPAWVLKCDVKKFFDSINHFLLLALLERQIRDEPALWLLRVIVGSFSVTPGAGLPLGNVTSQLFANLYLNELDQFAKYQLKTKYYVRYCDDFVIVHHSPDYLASLIPAISNFLNQRLALTLHPNKISIRKIGRGIDFLGYVTRPHYRILRTRTKKRWVRRAVAGEISDKNWLSYRGLLSHCSGHKIEEQIRPSS